MNLDRQPRCYSGNAGCVSANAKAVVSRDHVVTGAANPMQTVTNAIHDRLQPPNVALAILPGDESRDTRQTFHHCRTETRPVTAVDQHAQLRRVTYSAVVFKHPLVIRLRVIGWKRQDPIGAHFFRRLRQLNCELLAEPHTGDNRDATAYRFNCGSNYLLVLVWSQRIHLTSATGSNERANRVFEELRQILF